MPTTEKARLNLRTAARNVRARLGLSANPAEWSYEQRGQYNKALADAILTYPQSFTPEILTSAQRVKNSTYQALQDASFAWGEFAEETAANAVPVLGGFTNKLLVVLTVVGVVYLVFKSSLDRQAMKA
jgi:hypothetical protein